MSNILSKIVDHASSPFMLNSALAFDLAMFPTHLLHFVIDWRVAGYCVLILSMNFFLSNSKKKYFTKLTSFENK